MGNCTQAKKKSGLKNMPNPSQSARDIKDYYDLGRVVGSGNFGVVRKATRKDFSRLRVAIKSISKHKFQFDIELVRREIEILREMDHPNIVKYLEYFEDDRYLHIVTEYCSGGELLERLSSSCITEDIAARYMEKIMRAVNHLHSLNICHRDLKPQNFMFENKEEDAELKLIDFGLSNRFKSNLQRMNTFVGTPYYIAPEVIQGSYGPACDEWSCGIIMYVMLTGQLPFKGKNETEVFHNITQGKVKFTGKNRLSVYAHDLLRQLLRVDPSMRITADKALEHHWFADKFKSAHQIDPEILYSIAKYKKSSKLQGVAMGIMVKFLNIHEIQELKEAFLELDIDRNGYLSIEEVERGLNKIGIKMPPLDLQRLFKTLDALGNGMVNYSDFLTATMLSKVQIDEEKLSWAFNLLDTDHTNLISFDNLALVLENLGYKLSDQQIQDLIAEVDLDKEGTISFEEFRSIFTDFAHTHQHNKQFPIH